MLNICLLGHTRHSAFQLFLYEEWDINRPFDQVEDSCSQNKWKCLSESTSRKVVGMSNLGLL